MTDLNHLDELYEKATKGPWRSSRKDMDSYDSSGNHFVQIYCDDPNPKIHLGKALPLVVARLQEGYPRENADLVIALVNAWPSIRAELEAGRALAKRVEEMDFEDIDALETCSVPEMQDRVNAMRFGRNEQNAVWRAERDAALKAYNEVISKTE